MATDKKAEETRLFVFGINWPRLKGPSRMRFTDTILRVRNKRWREIRLATGLQRWLMIDVEFSWDPHSNQMSRIIQTEVNHEIRNWNHRIRVKKLRCSIRSRWESRRLEENYLQLDFESPGSGSMVGWRVASSSGPEETAENLGLDPLPKGAT